MGDRFYSFWQTCCRLYNLLSILFSKLWPQSNLASHTDCCDAGISRPRIGHSPAILSYCEHIQFCHHVAIERGVRSAGRSLCSFCCAGQPPGDLRVHPSGPSSHPSSSARAREKGVASRLLSKFLTSLPPLRSKAPIHFEERKPFEALPVVPQSCQQ
jgi:hypothetical protein